MKREYAIPVAFLIWISVVALCLSESVSANSQAILEDATGASGSVAKPDPAPSAIDFGVERFAESETMDRSFPPLLKYLGEKLGVRFVANYFIDDRAIVEHLKKGRIQIAHLSSQIYARCLLEGITDIRYVATVSDSSLPQPDFYRGYIFTRKEYPVESLADLEGKTFAFVNKTSGSGFSYPLMMLLKEGIDPKAFFSHVVFQGSHPAVTAAVIEKKVYAGATYDANFRTASQGTGDALKIVARTPPIPNEPWVAGKGVSEDFILRLRKILMSVDAQSRCSDGSPAISREFAKQLEIDSFSLRDEAFYEVVADMLRFTEKYNW